MKLLAYGLLPFSWLYQSIISIRRFCYQKKIFKMTRFPVPVIIIGNISLGGTGKTPLVIWLANQLKKHGLKPGIVSRGYGGKAKYYPCAVTANSRPAEVGDEPVIIAKQTKCPIYVAPNRVAAVKQLLKDHSCDIIIGDDGLQHYALARDIEVAVIDGERRLGNALCLPAGRLREPPKRLQEVDFIICNGGQVQTGEYLMQLIPADFCSVNKTQTTKTLDYFKNKTLHAVAGIGHPARFFKLLRQLGLTIIEHPFPDHHLFQKNEFNFAKDQLIVMTEKDAIKCQDFADENYWYLPVQAQLNNTLLAKILAKLNTVSA